MSREGRGCLVYKYTWSIGCCATWCNMPVPLPCCSLVDFKPLNSLALVVVSHPALSQPPLVVLLQSLGVILETVA